MEEDSSLETEDSSLETEDSSLEEEVSSLEDSREEDSLVEELSEVVSSFETEEISLESSELWEEKEELSSGWFEGRVELEAPSVPPQEARRRAKAKVVKVNGCFMGASSDTFP